MKKFTLIVSIFSIILTSKSYAWGKEGHQIIAEIAFKYLSENARTNVINYLDGTTFEDASTWMDEMRSNHNYDYMKTWHYINIEKGEFYVQNTDENLINIIIKRQKELEHLESLTSQKIKTDLQLLFHLIGDINQPLHVGYGNDRGGNNIEVNFLGDGTNLHSVWDSKIIKEQNISLKDCLQLMNSLSPQQIASIKKIDVVSWMHESRTYLANVYAFNGNSLGEDYARKNKQIIEELLLYAGLRLSAVLEKDFGGISRTSKATTKISIAGNNTITVDEAVNHIGETLTVSGKVFGSKYLNQSNGQPTLINMGGPYPDNKFTVVIFGSDRANFSYTPEDYLNNTIISVTGLIKLYKGKPEIIVSNESQINLK